MAASSRRAGRVVAVGAPGRLSDQEPGAVERGGESASGCETAWKVPIGTPQGPPLDGVLGRHLEGAVADADERGRRQDQPLVDGRLEVVDGAASPDASSRRRRPRSRSASGSRRQVGDRAALLAVGGDDAAADRRRSTTARSEIAPAGTSVRRHPRPGAGRGSATVVTSRLTEYLGRSRRAGRPARSRAATCASMTGRRGDGPTELARRRARGRAARRPTRRRPRSRPWSSRRCRASAVPEAARRSRPARRPAPAPGGDSLAKRSANEATSCSLLVAQREVHRRDAPLRCGDRGER